MASWFGGGGAKSDPKGTPRRSPAAVRPLTAWLPLPGDSPAPGNEEGAAAERPRPAARPRPARCACYSFLWSLTHPSHPLGQSAKRSSWCVRQTGDSSATPSLTPPGPRAGSGDQAEDQGRRQGERDHPREAAGARAPAKDAQPRRQHADVGPRRASHGARRRAGAR